LSQERGGTLWTRWPTGGSARWCVVTPASSSRSCASGAGTPDRWKRRASIICQLGSKGGTDVELLAHCIEANLDDPDFFLRKGIGWALREFAKTEPGWVRAFIDAHPDLSPLSRREATKHL
jgi:3-methyladenine DNA glycosylase AlkD